MLPDSLCPVNQTGESQTPAAKRSTLRDLGPAGLLALVWAILPGVLGITLIARLPTVSDYLRGQGTAQGLAMYAGGFMLAAGLGILPTYAQAILGGWCFGFSWGFPAALAGFVGAAAIGYFVARTIAAQRTERVIQTHPKARVIREALVGRGFWRTLGIVALLRVSPNSPFALTNLAMAGTRVPILPFVLGSLVGMAPRTAAAVMIGAGLGSLNEPAATHLPKWVLIAGVVLMLVALWVVFSIAQNALDRFKQAGDRAESADSTHRA